MFVVVRGHITLEYRFESVQTQGHFSNTAVHLARANSRGFWMARSLMLWLLHVHLFACPSCFPVGFPMDWPLWKSWPVYNIRLSLHCCPESTAIKAMLHCQDTIQHCKINTSFFLLREQWLQQQKDGSLPDDSCTCPDATLLRLSVPGMSLVVH